MIVAEATAPPVVVRAAERLPGWAGSIRFRLMVLYSVLLFGLATVVVGGIYAGLAQELRDQDVSRTEEMVRLFQPDEDGPIIGLDGQSSGGSSNLSSRSSKLRELIDG